jgi:predicted permease
VSIEQAALRMSGLQRQLWTETTSVAEGYQVELRGLSDVLTRSARLPLVVVGAGAAVLLLVACANVATLVLVRSTSRRREMALRSSLGARPLVVIRLFVLEAAILAFGGGLAGLALTWGALRALTPLSSALPRLEQSAVSGEVVLFATVAASLAGALIMSASLLPFRWGNVFDALRESSRTSAGHVTHRLRQGLVVVQIALATLLLLSGSLLLKSFIRVLRVDPGFASEHAVYFDLWLPNSRYPDQAAQTRFFQNMLEGLRASPRIEAAGALVYFPYKAKTWPSAVFVEGSTVPRGDEPIVFFNTIMGDYFAAMGIPLQAGRFPTFQETWDAKAARVALINETMARRLFGAANPLGRRFRTDESGTWVEIVGVVGDVRQQRLDLPPAAEFYATFGHEPLPFQSVVVRGHAERPVTLADVRAVMRQLDPGIALANLMPLRDYTRLHTRERQFAVWILSTFATLAMLLGAVGVYGAVSYTVGQRRREIGVRLALGATPGIVRTLIISQGLRLVALGTLVGLVAAFACRPILRRLLYGVTALDPVAYTAVPLLLGVATIVACWLPARSAARTTVADALRLE